MSFIYLFGVLRRFQHCTGHITRGSWKGRGNQYIQLVKVLHCKLPTNGKQLPAFPLKAMPETEPRPQRWEARVLPLCHRGPFRCLLTIHLLASSGAVNRFLIMSNGFICIMLTNWYALVSSTPLNYTYPYVLCMMCLLQKWLYIKTNPSNSRDI